MQGYSVLQHRQKSLDAPAIFIKDRPREIIEWQHVYISMKAVLGTVVSPKANFTHRRDLHRSRQQPKRVSLDRLVQLSRQIHYLYTFSTHSNARGRENSWWITANNGI